MTNPYAAPETEAIAAGVGPALGDRFLALRTSRTGRDTCFAFRVHDGRLIGYPVARQFHSASAVRWQLGLAYLTVVAIPILELFALYVTWRRRRAEREAERGIEPPPDAVVVPLERIALARVTRRRSHHMFWTNRGTLDLELVDGRTLPFLLVVDPTVELAVDVLVRAAVRVERDARTPRRSIGR